MQHLSRSAAKTLPLSLSLLLNATELAVLVERSRNALGDRDASASAPASVTSCCTLPSLLSSHAGSGPWAL